MNNREEMILLTWYKGTERSPWVLTLEDENRKIHEVTLGEKGYATAGPRLQEDLVMMEEQIYRYPMQYDMRQIENRTARMVEVHILKNRITNIESSLDFQKELEKSYRQTPFQPLEEEVTYAPNSRYIESPRPENTIMRTVGYQANGIATASLNQAQLLTEYAPNSHIFWLFIHPQNVKVIDSSTIEAYISAYNWPQGYEVPEMVGRQNILDSQVTVRIDLLGLKSLGRDEEDAASRYGLVVDEQYDPSVIRASEREAKAYLRELIQAQGILAVSLQYSTETNQPVENNDNLLGVAYSTSFEDLTEIRNSILNETFHGVNINKSMLKEFYSKNEEIKENYDFAQDVPLVEYVNQSEGQEGHGINISSWINEAGIQSPPTTPSTDNTEAHTEDAEEVMDRIVEETVQDDIENNRSREDHYIHGYINNDLSFIPPNDDRLEDGTLYNEIYEGAPISEDEDVGALPYDYTHKVRIGDVMLEIPPLSIKATKQQANESVSTIRSRNSMHKGVGNSRQVLTMELYFHDLDNINGHKTLAFTRDNGQQVFYYMDGLRTLLAQFIKSPFVPIDNDYINDSLGVHNVALQTIQAETVEGFPEAVMVVLVVEEVDVAPYLLGETNLGEVFNYPLYRWYYQQSLQEPTTSFHEKTYLPAIEQLNNIFRFQIANEAYLSERTDIIRQFNAMQTPAQLRRELEQQMEEEGKEEEVNDNKAASNALVSYHAFQDFYNNLPQETKDKYKPHELPIYTTPGQDSNLKGGELQEIENGNEYQLGVEAGKAIYGGAFQSESVTNLLYNSATGDFGETKRGKLNPLKSGSVIGADDSVFIGAYQLSNYGILNQLIKDNNLPGIIQVHVQDKSHQNRLNDLLAQTIEYGEDQGYSELGGPGGNPYSNTYFDDDTIFVPAGTINGIDYLSVLEEIGGQGSEVDNEVEEYTKTYNQMVARINESEADIPMDDFIIEDLIPLSLNVSLANNLSMVQAQAAKTPSFQYLGAQQPEVQISFSTTDQGVKQVDELFRTIARYAKEYRSGLVTNFMTIENPLVNLFGVNAVLPHTFEINTVESQPDQKIVTMILTGFDKTQRKQEALYAFAGGKVSKDMKDLHLDGYDPQVNSLYIHEKMKHMEVYPDLELPTFDDLERDLPYLGSGVNKIENRTNQVFLDPDFYISTQTTVRKQLSEILGDSRGAEINLRDDFGIEATANVSFNQGLTVAPDSEGKVDDINDLYVDPYLEWKGYEGEEPAEDAEEEDDELAQIEEDLPVSSGLGQLVETDMGKHVPEGQEDYENPSDEEVWDHLYRESLRIFGDYEEVLREEIEGIASMKDGKDNEQLQAIAASPMSQFLAAHAQVIMPTKNHFSDYSATTKAQSTNMLKNGLRATILKTASEKLIGEDMPNIQLHQEGNSLIPQLPSTRLFMYMKTLVSSESNWRQFNADGSPFIGARLNSSDADKQGLPYKVGIMGAPLHKASDAREVEKLSLDWRYNITFSLTQMKATYDQARKNTFHDFTLRPIDWAIASHSGVAMPDVLVSGDKKDDKTWTRDKLLVAPESLVYFATFAQHYQTETSSVKNGNPLAFFRTPSGVQTNIMVERLGVTEEEVAELTEESLTQESNNFDQYTLEDKIKHMYVDMQEYDQTGRMIRAFPSFSLMLIDEGKWFQNFRTWDNFYGYNALHSIDVYRSRKIAADTAVITMSNMYGNLSSSHGSQSNPDLRLPSFFSNQFWEHYVFGRPTEDQLESRMERYDQIMLQPGARVHLRMGYSADASHLPVVFNGSIAEMSTEEVIEITAQGDAVELQNVISGDPEDDNIGFMNRVQEPRKTIGELMTAKGNWIREIVNEATDSTFFKESPMGIAHFGSTIHSETGNRAILPGAHSEEFGESLQNVYSQNGMEQKSQWHHEDGSEISVLEMAGSHVKEFITNISVVLGKTPSFDESNIAVSYYGRTVWEIIQGFALASQDYVAMAVPFEFRSTLFFGKPHWMMQYRYDSDFVYDSDREKIDRTVRDVHQKTFMQAHIYNSYYNILNNQIIASEQGVYNNVVVTYDGRQAGPIQADSDIRFDKQRTIDIEANILAPRKIEYYRAEDQALIYGQSTLRDFMKDMYKGEYTVLGDATVKPHDVIYLNDSILDMHGLHLVKAVHQSMDGEHGFVTHIEPDAFVYNFDEELGEISTGLFTIGKNLNMHSVGASVGAGLTAVLASSVLAKIMNKTVASAAGAITSGTAKVLNSKVAMGTAKRTTAKFFEVAGGLYNKSGGAVKVASQIKNAKNMTEYKTLVSAANSALRGDIAGASGAAAETAGFMQKTAQGFVEFANGSKTMSNVGKLTSATKKAGSLIKGIVTSKAFIFTAATVVFEMATSWIGEWWTRKKQNAEAVKVVPLIYQGKSWTALMNWSKGAVVGDDPSLRDKLMNAEFFDEDLDPEVNEVFGNSLFKFLNLFTDE